MLLLISNRKITKNKTKLGYIILQKPTSDYFYNCFSKYISLFPHPCICPQTGNILSYEVRPGSKYSCPDAG